MLTKEDIRRIEFIGSKSSDIGERVNDTVVKFIKVLCSKVGLLIVGSVITISFFTLGLFGRKGK